MSKEPNPPVYLCPMHPDVREAQSGRCPTCGMSLVPEGTRFKFLQQMGGTPIPLAVMAAIMIVAMAAGMMMR